MSDSLATLDPPTGTADADDRLRDWLRSAEERFAWFRHVAASHEVAKATKLFGKRANRARGRIALQRAFEPVAILQAVGDEGRLPFLCWACFRPRDEARIVSIDFAMVLRFPDGRVSIVAMTWTADVSHDALADALEHGERDLDGLLMQLHAALLDGPADDDSTSLSDNDVQPSLVADVTGPVAVPSGSGFFLGLFVRGMTGDQPAITYHALRWVPDPPADAAPIGVAAEGEARLSDHWLDPVRLASAQFSPSAGALAGGA